MNKQRILKYKIILLVLVSLTSTYPAMAQDPDPTQVDVDYDSPSDAVRVISALDREMRIMAKRDYDMNFMDMDYTPVTKIIDEISDPYMLFVLAVTFDQLHYPYRGIALASEDDEKGQADEAIRGKLYLLQHIVVDHSIDRLRQLEQAGNENSQKLLELLKKIVYRMTIPV